MNVINVLGLDMQVKEWNRENNLPMYITNIFTIKKANINGIECIMLIPGEELPSIPNLKKQIDKIKSVDDLPIFLNLNQLSSFRRDNLLLNKIPFILKKQLVYLPFLGTVLTDKKTDYTNKQEKFTKSTQLLFIWILHRNTNRYYIMDAIQNLPFSNMTLTRAYRQLIQTDLFTENKEGRKIYLTTKYSKEELFEKAKSYFISPITTIGYIEKEKCIPEMIESGETALSKYTMIHSPLPRVYAIDKKYKDLLVIEDELVNPKEQIRVELWEYNPLFFSKDNKNIDFILLAISLINNQDERVEHAIEDLLTQMWEKSNDSDR